MENYGCHATYVVKDGLGEGLERERLWVVVRRSDTGFRIERAFRDPTLAYAEAKRLRGVAEGEHYSVVTTRLVVPA